MFMKEFDLNQDGKVTWEEFSAGMQKMKEKINKKADCGKEYKSHL